MNKARKLSRGTMVSFSKLFAVMGVAVISMQTAVTLADSETRVAKRIIAPGSGSSDMVRALEIAKESRKAMSRVADYEANFVKKELIGRRLVQQKMRLKLREQPFSVYIKYEKPHAGREVIFVNGRNQNMLLAHGTGLEALVGTVRLLPNSRDAMHDNRYPITMLGMSQMLDKIIQQWETDQQFADIDVKFFPNAKFGEYRCRAIQTTHTVPRQGAKFHMTRLYIDKDSNLPVRVEQFGFPRRSRQTPPLIEEYSYLNLRANIGLRDEDFDTRNSRYGY